MMALDEDGDKSDGNTAAASVLGKKLAWMRELGFINDTLADFNLSDSKQKTLLEDRQKKLLDMIHAASNPKIRNILKESPKKTFKPRNTSNNSENPVNYWQKTLPKLPPLPADFEKKYSSTALKSPAPPKATKSLYESRYAN